MRASYTQGGAEVFDLFRHLEAQDIAALSESCKEQLVAGFACSRADSSMISGDGRFPFLRIIVMCPASWTDQCRLLAIRGGSR